MRHTIVTMSRGDAARLPEWVRYHARLGFDEFHILLDNPNDDSEAVLASLSAEVTITVEVKDAIGYYHPEGLTQAQRLAQADQWCEEHAAEIAESGMPIVDALSWRQYRHLPAALERYTRREPGSGWLSILDVDEFIVLPPGQRIADLLAGVEKPRVRLTSFNMDTSNWDSRSSLLQTVSQRWSYDDMLAYGQGWPDRVKALIRYESALPLHTVHAINRGPFERAEVEQARVLHYKYPTLDILPYPVEDWGALEAWRAGEVEG